MEPSLPTPTFEMLVWAGMSLSSAIGCHLRTGSADRARLPRESSWTESFAKSRKVLRTTKLSGKGASRTLSDDVAVSNEDDSGRGVLSRVLLSDEELEGSLLGVDAGVLTPSPSAEPPLLSAAVLALDSVEHMALLQEELQVDCRDIAQLALRGASAIFVGASQDSARVGHSPAIMMSV